MRIIARRTLREFVESLAGKKDQPAVKAALDAWFYEVSKAAWKSSADVKRRTRGRSARGPYPPALSMICLRRTASMPMPNMITPTIAVPTASITPVTIEK